MDSFIRRSENMVIMQNFRILDNYKQKAQHELNSIINMVNTENIFQKFTRIIKGYNNKLLIQYTKKLSLFIEYSSSILTLWDSILRSNIEITENQLIIDTIKSIISLYKEVLLNKESFKKNKNNIFAIELKLNIIIKILKSITMDYIQAKASEQSEEKINIQEQKTTKGFIDINEYMINSFN